MGAAGPLEPESQRAENTMSEGARAVYVNAGALQTEKKGEEGGLGRCSVVRALAALAENPGVAPAAAVTELSTVAWTP